MKKKLEVNAKKSAIIKFKDQGRSQRERTITYQGQLLQMVKEFTYLGVTFAASGSFKPNLERALSKGRAAIGSI